MRTRVAFETLGCRLNQYETDAIATRFRRGGYEIVPFGSETDCLIVNTCTVTDRADRKSRNIINRARREGEHEVAEGFDNARGPVVVVTGCYAESREEELSSLPGVTYVVGNEQKQSIFDLVDAHFRQASDPEGELSPDRFGFGDGAEGFHTRETIKVQDGCDNFCTFCICRFFLPPLSMLQKEM